MQKIILCADMDAFFASIEQQANPNLRGKPIAVTGSAARTVVVTRSYEARAFGVKTGMNIYEARKACPHLIFVAGDNEKYTYTCSELEKIYKKYTPDIEIYSIDEAFLDITTTHHLFDGPEELASRIKKEIKEQFNINCTIGIGPNILIAKLVSDISKPDGLRWVKEEEVAGLLENMSVKELWGIGPKTAEKLAAMGISSCGALGRMPVSLLRSRFGIMGEHLKAMGQGRCERVIAVNEADPKTIGHSMTLPKDISSRQQIDAHMLQLSDMVGSRARRHGFAGSTVTLTIRYPDFETFTKQLHLPEHTNHTQEIYRAAVRLLDSVKLKDKVRLLGISISSLERVTGQLLLFRESAKQKALLSAVDAINDKYGEFKITWASYSGMLEKPRVIAPAWRPSGVRNIRIKK
ncbi:MAG: DNA polymerase IV [Dissulfurispiraceae bacterium]|jgi:DNA polymerase-4|nr:DNA polymerase IV [Dissulfurispiraceae bacterium]